MENLILSRYVISRSRNFRLLYDRNGFYGIYRVLDQYIRGTCSKDQQMVCLDSCVEFFVKPATGVGYINFEFNCSGILLASQVIDPNRNSGRIAKCSMLTAEECAMVKRHSTLPAKVDPELVGAKEWQLSFFIPFALFEPRFGSSIPQPGDLWHGIFYKCGDRLSHPHWGCWKQVDRLNFHLPDQFGDLCFA